ncbi:MAG: hypothetical protein CM15mP39_11010 [Synechococcus sp.]|nr:MAG: hypothetical protein CM15mP39_11010 [Synechococcus sp.]
MKRMGLPYFYLCYWGFFRPSCIFCDFEALTSDHAPMCPTLQLILLDPVLVWLTNIVG